MLGAHVHINMSQQAMCIFMYSFTFSRILQGSWEMAAKEDNAIPITKENWDKGSGNTSLSQFSEGHMREHMVFSTDIHFCIAN